MKTIRSFRRPLNAGFTLLEIMLVIIIVVALMAVLLPNLKNALSGGKEDIARIYISSQLAGSIAQYEMSNGAPPTSGQGLKALVEKPDSEPKPRRWRQYLQKLELDPWGMPYNYVFPGTRSKSGYDVFSAGPDRQPNTQDDVGNWD